MSTPTTTRKAEHDDFGYAWEWFRFHGEQRMTTFNFYLIVFGALLAITLTTIEKGMFYVSSFLSLVGLAITFLFYKLDERNRYLIKIGEQALDAHYAADGDNAPSTSTLVELASKKPKGMLSFRQVFSGFFVIVALSSAIALIYSLSRIILG